MDGPASFMYIHAEMKTIGHAWDGRHDVLPRVVTTVAREIPRPGCSTHFTNAQWVLDYAKDQNGWGRAGSPGAPWRLRSPGTAHLYAPGTPYWEDTRRDASTTLRSAFILFEGGERAGLQRLLRAPFGYARFTDPTGALLELLDELATVGQRCGESGFWQAQSLFCRVLDLLLRAQHQADELFQIAAPQTVAPQSFAASVDDYLRRHLSERIRLTDVARHFHVSLSSLAHRYRSEAEQSPAARLIALRVNMAKGLLLSGQRLDTVAAQTGFYDAYHLSKSFKRALGLSPREFVRQAQRNQTYGKS